MLELLHSFSYPLNRADSLGLTLLTLAVTVIVISGIFPIGQYNALATHISLWISSIAVVVNLYQVAGPLTLQVSNTSGTFLTYFVATRVGLAMLMLTILLTWAIVIYQSSYNPNRNPDHDCMLALFLLFASGLFLSGDTLMFTVCFELMNVPIVVMLLTRPIPGQSDSGWTPNKGNTQAVTLLIGYAAFAGALLVFGLTWGQSFSAFIQRLSRALQEAFLLPSTIHWSMNRPILPTRTVDYLYLANRMEMPRGALSNTTAILLLLTATWSPWSIQAVVEALPLIPHTVIQRQASEYMLSVPCRMGPHTQHMVSKLLKESVTDPVASVLLTDTPACLHRYISLLLSTQSLQTLIVHEIRGSSYELSCLLFPLLPPSWIDALASAQEYLTFLHGQVKERINLVPYQATRYLALLQDIIVVNLRDIWATLKELNWHFQVNLALALGHAHAQAAEVLTLILEALTPLKPTITWLAKVILASLRLLNELLVHQGNNPVVPQAFIRNMVALLPQQYQEALTNADTWLSSVRSSVQSSIQRSTQSIVVVLKDTLSTTLRILHWLAQEHIAYQQMNQRARILYLRTQLGQVRDTLTDFVTAFHRAIVVYTTDNVGTLTTKQSTANRGIDNVGSRTYPTQLHPILLLLGILRLWAIYIAGAVKVSLMPLHSWLCKVHVECSTVGSVLLAGVGMKSGYYLHALTPQVTQTCHNGAQTVLLLLGCALLSINTLNQVDSKRWVAIYSVGHVQLLYLIWQSYGPGHGDVSVAVFLGMVGHSLIASSMFVAVGALADSMLNRLLATLGLTKLDSSTRLTLLFLILTNGAYPWSTLFMTEVTGLVSSTLVSIPLSTTLVGLSALNLVTGLVTLGRISTEKAEKRSWWSSSFLTGLVYPLILLAISLGMHLYFPVECLY